MWGIIPSVLCFLLLGWIFFLSKKAPPLPPEMSVVAMAGSHWDHPLGVFIANHTGIEHTIGSIFFQIVLKGEKTHRNCYNWGKENGAEWPKRPKKVAAFHSFTTHFLTSVPTIQSVGAQKFRIVVLRGDGKLFNTPWMTMPPNAWTGLDLSTSKKG